MLQSDSFECFSVCGIYFCVEKQLLHLLAILSPKMMRLFFQILVSKTSKISVFSLSKAAISKVKTFCITWDKNSFVTNPDHHLQDRKAFYSAQFGRILHLYFLLSISCNISFRRSLVITYERFWFSFLKLPSHTLLPMVFFFVLFLHFFIKAFFINVQSAFSSAIIL